MMFGMIYFVAGASADVGAQISLGSFTPNQNLEGILEGAMQGNTKLYWKHEPFHIGLTVQGSVHSGLHYTEQAEANCASLAVCIQGDTWIGSGGAYVGMDFETSFLKFIPYIELKATTLPLLMDEVYYNEEVVVAWSGYSSTYHKGIKPTASIGIDIRVPFWENGPGAFITADMTYIMEVDLFTKWGIGFFVE